MECPPSSSAASRRTRRELRGLFAGDGPSWKVLKITYFSTFLLPVIWATRMMKNARYGLDPDPARSDSQPARPLVNSALLRIFQSERHWLRHSRLPVGRSLILVAQK